MKLIDPDGLPVADIIALSLVVGSLVSRRGNAVVMINARFAEVAAVDYFPMVTPILIAGVMALYCVGTVVGDSAIPWLQFTWAFASLLSPQVILFEHMVAE